MTVIKLSSEELSLCGYVGVRRQVAAFVNGWKLYGNPDGTEALFEHHIGGVIAEYAVARFLNLQWAPAIGVIDGVDVGGLVEVRMRLLPGTGRELAMRPKDHDDKPYVLVHVHRARPHAPEIVGWLFGREGKRPDWDVDPKRLVWFIPPPYRDLEALIEWVRERR